MCHLSEAPDILDLTKEIRTLDADARKAIWKISSAGFDLYKLDVLVFRVSD